MPSLTEAFRSARQRVNPEGVAFGATISSISYPVMTALSAGITIATHEIAKETDPTLLKLLAIGILGVAGGASVFTETKALNAEKYSASWVGSGLFMLTGRPLPSSLTEHLVNYAQSSVLNPVNWVALLGAISSGDNQLLIQSGISTPLALDMLFITANAMVLKGKTRLLVETVKRGREIIVKKIRRTNV